MKTASFGRVLAHIRAARGLSIAELAAAACVSGQYVRDLEHDRKSPTLAVMRRLASALDATVAELAGEQCTK
jgi:transcriptional regulator with XRE-family HTH domain